MRIVCFGDSLTSCGPQDGRFSDILQDRFPTHEIVNAGVGGETLVDALDRVAEVIALRPDVVLLEFGANDWWRDERPHQAWAEDLERLIVQLQGCGSRVALLGCFGDYLDEAGGRQPKVYGIDERAIAYREHEARLAAAYDCPYMPNIQEWIIGRRCCWADRNHPNEYGNRFVADAISPMLSALTGEAPRAVRLPTIHSTRDMWREAVALAPQREAVVDGERRLTYAEADDLVRRLAAGFSVLCGGRPPIVAVYLPNCLEYFLAYWAVMELGGIVVPLNIFIKHEPLAEIFANIRPDILLAAAATDRLPIAAAAVAAPTLVTVADDGATTWAGLLATPPRATTASGPGEMAAAIIMHTSGTTGVPKGAVMRHHDLLFNVTATINAFRLQPSDRHLLVNPMYHATALYSLLPAAALQKSCIVITADTSPSGLMQLVARERLTTFLTVPSICQRLTAMPDLDQYDRTSLRLIGYAGSMMPVSTIRQLQRHFPEVALQNFFGLTETTSATHVMSGGDADERPDSIGRLLPFVEAMIVDDALQPLPPGNVGQLLFARENVISTYYRQPDRLQAALVEVEGRQWFATGDLASVDEEGYFFIKGRKKDMIIVGGENVYAAEVEAVLMAHDLVREAAVKGVPASGVRASLGEMIRAYVVSDGELSERDLKRHCAARLASFQIPHELVFLAELPRNPTGKVVKDELP